MSFDWSQYLLVAKELAGQGTILSSQEARLRTAVSRAYYAAFCKASNHLRDKDRLPIARQNYEKHEHSYVINTFDSNGDPVRHGVGQDLRRLFSKRTMADYHDNAPGLTANQVALDLALAELVIANVDGL